MLQTQERSRGFRILPEAHVSIVARFLATSGYVPLAVAYGMEEVDLALRLHEKGGRILRTPGLRVFHDTDLKRHANPAVTAGTCKPRVAHLPAVSTIAMDCRLWPVLQLHLLADSQ